MARVTAVANTMLKDLPSLLLSRHCSDTRQTKPIEILVASAEVAPTSYSGGNAIVDAPPQTDFGAGDLQRPDSGSHFLNWTRGSKRKRLIGAVGKIPGCELVSESLVGKCPNGTGKAYLHGLFYGPSVCLPSIKLGA